MPTNSVDSLKTNPLGSLALKANSITGSSAQAGADWQAVYNPYDDSEIGIFEYASDAQIQAALDELQTGFQILSRDFSAYARSEILRKVAALLEERSEQFAQLICQEVGKPIQQARFEVKKGVDILELTAEETMRIGGEIIPLNRRGNNANRLTSLTYEPLGIVLAITPFNFPLGTVIHKVAPALGAGNAVLLKPSPHAPLIAYNFAQLFFEAGLPSQALCYLNLRNEQTATLAASEQIHCVNFTGSAQVGWGLRSKLAPGASSILELGGNSPVIVAADAKLPEALAACVRGAFAFSGQACISVQRVLLHVDIAEQFISDMIEQVSQLVPGNPQEEATDLGPLISQAACERLQDFTADAVAGGAKLLWGGEKLPHNGYAPTILTETHNHAKVRRDEAFGPIVCIEQFRDIDRAIAEANATKFGLSAGLFTQDLDQAFRLSKALNFASVMVNESATFRADEMPITARKHSGQGMEGPRYAIREMSQAKVTSINLCP